MAMSRTEMKNYLLNQGIPIEMIEAIISSRPGPKGADIERGKIYFRVENGERQVYLTYAIQVNANGIDRIYNAASWLNGLSRDQDEHILPPVKPIKNANLGEPILDFDEVLDAINDLIDEKLQERAEQEQEEEALAEA